MKPKHLIFSQGNELEFLNIVLNLVQQCKLMNYQPILVHFSNSLHRQDAYSRTLLKFGRLHSPDNLVISRLKQEGIKVYHVDKYYSLKKQYSITNESMYKINSSIRSSIISITQDENYSIESNKSLHNKFKEEALLAYNAVRFIIEDNRPEVLSVCNGRFPVQRGTWLAGVDEGIKVNFYERGMYQHNISPEMYTVDSYKIQTDFWYQNFTSQDREKTQEFIKSKFLNLKNIDTQPALKWLDNREIMNDSNRFVISSYNKLPKFSKPIISIFTSSQDEFSELDETWRLSKWNNQWEAFEALLSKIDSNKFDIILRVHPNNANKFKKIKFNTLNEIKKIKDKFPSINIINSLDKVNQYELVKISEIVVVWNSTIGLEASARGKKVICLQASEYDQVADIKSWFDEEEFNFDSLVGWIPEKIKALNYMQVRLDMNTKANSLLEDFGIDINYLKNIRGRIANRWNYRGSRIKNLLSIIISYRLRQKIKKAYSNLIK